MPRYYFNLRFEGGFERDVDGLEMRDLEAAYLEAFRAIFTVTMDLLGQGKRPATYTFEITDESGQLLVELPFSEGLGFAASPAGPRNTMLRRRTDVAFERTLALCNDIKEERDKMTVALEEIRSMIRTCGDAMLPLEPGADGVD